MDATRPASEVIAEEVGSWPGVSVEEGDDFGELSIRLGNRELGHLHGDAAAHFSFPKSTWDGLYAEGRIMHHPVFPDRRGPAQREIRNDEDVRDVVDLFRMIYDRATARRAS